MQKHLPVLLFLVLFGTVVSAQYYTNIITPGTTFYSGTLYEPGFLSGVKLDSANSPGSGDTLFLSANTIRDKVPFGSPLDTVGGILGRRIIKSGNGLFLFFNSYRDSIFLNTAAGLNTYRKFFGLPNKGQIRATCTSIHQMSFLGASDTVKEFTFQALDSNGVNIPGVFNGRKILLSRNYGFIKILDLRNFPADTAVFTLEGKNNPPIGFQGMTNHDLYDFEVGDEFHFLGHTNYLWGNHPSTKDYKIIRKVVAKQVAPGGNSVAYSFEYCKEEITYSPVGSSTVYQSDTIAISYPYGSTLADQTVNWLPEKFSHTNYRYYSTLQHLVPGRPAYGKRDNRYICCWGNYPYYQLYIKNEFEYAKGLGQVHYKNCWTYFDVINYDNEDLVYYKKGNEHWGSPVAASCQVMVPVFSVTPDPVVLGYTAGSSAILTINTNQAWTVTSTSDFFDYEPATGYMNGTVTITAKNENTGSSVLVGALNVNFPTESKSIKVHQLINPVPTTIYHPDTIVLGWKRLSLDTLYVTSNTTFELICTPCPSWFLPSTYIGTGTEIVRFASFEDNLDSAVRMAVVTFTGPAGSKDIVVTQKGKTAGFGTRNTFGVKLSPNPVRESAVLSFSGMPGIREKHLTLFDYTGRVVYQSRFTSLEYQFQRGSLPPGIYLLKVSYRHDLPDALINVMLE